jgi:hypothetical protein
MTSDGRMLPFATVKPVIGGAFGIGPNAQEGAKGVERVEAPVKAKGKFVEVGLKVLWANAVVTASKPAFHIAENKVNDRQGGCQPDRHGRNYLRKCERE